MTPLCSCHGEPMERNPGSVGGWRCLIRKRAQQRRYYHDKQKDDPSYQLNWALREMTRIRVTY